ncbi:MAG TPA: hypothetical protein VJI75_06590 [Candidatus Nanoarchaeia archaeon]|nr:hypothetical protein [Candidatus Nanoarchaeia archaeon]
MMVGMDKITDSVTLGSSVTGIPQSLDEQLGWMEQSRMNPLEVDNWRRIHPSLGNVKTSLQRDRIIKQLEWAIDYFAEVYAILDNSPEKKSSFLQKSLDAYASILEINPGYGTIFKHNPEYVMRRECRRASNGF